MKEEGRWEETEEEEEEEIGGGRGIERFLSSVPGVARRSPVTVLLRKTDPDNVMKRGCTSGRLHNEGQRMQI